MPQLAESKTLTRSNISAPEDHFQKTYFYMFPKEEVQQSTNHLAEK